MKHYLVQSQRADVLALSIADATRPALRRQDEQSFLASPYGVMFLSLIAAFVGIVIGALI